MNIFSALHEFHEKFGLRDANPGQPRLLSPHLFTVRSQFIGEELNEFVVSHMEGDLVNALHELIDVIYVATGTIDLMGFTPEQAEHAFQRIHAANMAKIRVENATESKRNTAFDVRKPEGWKPADLTDLCKGAIHVTQ